MSQKSMPFQLEICSQLPSEPKLGLPPLVFVHGAYMGAWCWQEHFLPYFSQQGYRCYAVSLRGHGASQGREILDTVSMADYVDDLAQVVESLPQPPVLIGHSMGGLVVQYYLNRHTPAGAVLLASVPPYGQLSSALRLALHEPGFFRELNMIQHVSPSCATLDNIRRGLFSAGVSDDDLRRWLPLMQRESLRAIMDMSFSYLNPPKRRADIPVLVLGGEKDAFFSSTMIQTTANNYGVNSQIIPEVAHMMMLDPAWKIVAASILSWLKQLGRD